MCAICDELEAEERAQDTEPRALSDLAARSVARFITANLSGEARQEERESRWDDCVLTLNALARADDPKRLAVLPPSTLN